MRFFKSILFVVPLVGVLGASTIALGGWAFSLSAQVATLTARLSATTLSHRKDLMKVVSRTKAKARLRRLVAAAPFVGIAALAYFEEQDYQECLKENPQGTRTLYACEVAAMTAEVIDEVLQELPEKVRPSPEQVSGYLPTNTDCDNGT